MTAPTLVPGAAPIIGAEERAAVDRVLRSGTLVQGAEVAAFEQEFSAVVAARECVAVSSGTAALHLMLLAHGIGPGDEVVVPSFTFAATANAVALTGARPVFADIEPESFCLDPDAAAAAVTARTAAVLAVHLYGHPADMAGLARVAGRHGLALFEDAAQAHAASLGGHPVGSRGEAAAFSFYPTKNMTTGEGGLVACAEPAVAARIRLLRNQGMAQRYANEVVGFNLRMTEMAAAMGRVQLTRLPGWTRRRQATARFYDEALPDECTPPVAAGAEHVYHQYTLRVPRRDAVAAHLRAAGIGAAIYYPVPVHRLPAFAADVDLPVTEEACRQVVSVPVHPGVDHAGRRAVAGAVLDALSAAGRP